MTTKRKFLKITQNIGALLLLIVSIYFIGREIDLAVLIRQSGQIELIPVLMLFLTSIIASILKGQRLLNITYLPLSLGQMSNISIVHSYLASMLPFKLGELALPALLKKFANYSISKAFGKLIFIRILDTALIVLVGVFLTLFVSSLAFMKFASILLLVAIIVFLAIVKSDFALKFLKKIPLLNKGKGILEAINEISYRQYMVALILTVGAWIFTYIASYYSLTAVGLDVPILVVAVWSTLLILSVAIPIQTPGMVGTYEAITLFVFAMFDIKGSGVLEMIVLSHILAVVVNSAIAGVSGIILFIQGRQLELPDVDITEIAKEIDS